MPRRKTEWNDAIKAELKAIGEKVKDHRTLLCHMSQQEVAERAGISVSTLSRIEHGEADVTYGQLATLSQVFNDHAPYVVSLSHILAPSQDQTASMLDRVKSMRAEAEAMTLDKLAQNKDVWRESFGVDVEDIYERRQSEMARGSNTPLPSPNAS